jgi:hypothetical protein
MRPKTPRQRVYRIRLRTAMLRAEARRVNLPELKPHQQLESLDLTFTAVISKAGVAELQKALPRCRVFHNTAK